MAGAMTMESASASGATSPEVNKKEFEAGLSLLHMLQRASDSEGEEQPVTSSSPSTNSSSGLNDALLLAAARQMDPKGIASDDDEEDDEKNWSSPKGHGGGSYLRRNTQLASTLRDMDITQLRMHFNKPIVEVAKEFGICTTFLKKICRRCGIKRWPHRQIRSLSRTIEMLRQAEASATSPQEKMKFTIQIADVEAKMRAVIEDPDANGKLERVKKSVINRSGSPTAKIKKATPVSSSAPPALLQAAAAALAASEAEAELNQQPVVVVPTVQTVSTKPQLEKIDVTVSAPEALAARTPTASAGPSVPTAPGPDTDLKISPSHRKLLALVKSEGESRLRTNSMGSLQEQTDDVTMTDVADAPVV